MFLWDKTTEKKKLNIPNILEYLRNISLPCILPSQSEEVIEIHTKNVQNAKKFDNISTNKHILRLLSPGKFEPLISRK